MRARLVAIVVAAVAVMLACASPSGGTQPPTSGKSAAPSAPAQQPAAQPSAPGAQSAPAASAAPTPGPLRKVKLAYGFVGAEVIPMWLAFDQGTYQKYGLDVEATLMQSSAQIAPAMAAGDIDVALTAGAGVVDIDLAGGDQLIIAAHNNYMRFMMHARPELRRVEDLRDKRLAITRFGSGIHLASIIILQRAGLESGRDVQLIQAGGVDNVLAALSSGSADAGLLATPFDLYAARAGFPLLADTKDYRIPYMQGAIAVRRGTLESQYDLVRDFMRAHAEALGRAKREPALAKRLLGEQTKSDDQELLDISYRLWTEDLTELMYPNPDAVQSVLDQRAPEIAAARTANPRDFLDDRVLRDLEASGFLRPALAAQ